MRLFAGLAVPPLVEDRLSALRLRLAAPRDGLRWSTPVQWHLTLRFFGDLEPEQISVLVEQLRDFRHAPPSLRMQALGLFPAKGILFAALEPSEELSVFHAAVNTHFAGGLAPASSLPFHPHITLARSKGPSGLKSLRTLASPTLPSFGSALQWTSGPIHLYESVLGPQGAAYRPVATQAPCST